MNTNPPREHRSIRLHALTLCALLTLATLATGCACFHRTTRSTHTVEWFAGRPDGLVARATDTDCDGGGVLEWFDDATATNMTIVHSNQEAIGGMSIFSVGGVGVKVDTNTAPIIGATRTSLGNVIGAAVKTAVK